MSQWIIDLLIGIGGPLIAGATGIYVGTRLDRSKTVADAKTEARTEAHAMIDQLQEERAVRESQVAVLQARIDSFYTDKHASRIFVAALIDHIWQRKQPPPPEPPAGYIP